MKLIYLFSFILFVFSTSIFSQKITLVNFPMQNGCSDSLSLEFSEQKISHPIKGMPKSIKLFETNSEIEFKFLEWKRFYDSILTTYTTIDNQKLYIDDFCMWELEVYTCLSHKGCSYLLPSSYLD